MTVPDVDAGPGVREDRRLGSSVRVRADSLPTFTPSPRGIAIEPGPGAKDGGDTTRAREFRLTA